eukprot:TRINITY_DN32494_c0_g1_i1.p1 TRINITY_DN32494_c0_g1~~TRINITY_DN32494_c0_g1_i1.p1  ORF type:complete len:798 (+),score=223.38 TRINITY_DN32494_c0_g1_i1:55-2448(+)
MGHGSGSVSARAGMDAEKPASSVAEPEQAAGRLAARKVGVTVVLLTGVVCAATLQLSAVRRRPASRLLPTTPPSVPPPSASPDDAAWSATVVTASTLRPSRCTRRRCSNCGPGLVVAGAEYGGVGALAAALRGHKTLRPAQEGRGRVDFWAETRGPRNHAWEFTQNYENGTERLKGVSWYRSLWKGLSEDQVGYDLSPAYLTAPGVPADVVHFLSGVKVAVVVSDPAVRSYAQWTSGRKPLPRGKVRAATYEAGIREDLLEYVECMNVRPLSLFRDNGAAFCAQRAAALMPGGYLSALQPWVDALHRGSGREPRLLVLFSSEVRKDPAAAIGALEDFLCIDRTGHTPPKLPEVGPEFTPVPDAHSAAADAVRLYHKAADARLAEVLRIRSVPWAAAPAGGDDREVVLGSRADALDTFPTPPPKTTAATLRGTAPQTGRGHCTAAAPPPYACGGKLLAAASRCSADSLAPGLLVLGQQKCATTTLGMLLQLHPNFARQQTKELQYFSAGYGAADPHMLHMYYKAHRASDGGRRWYIEQFAAAWKGTRRAGTRPIVCFDNSASYLSDGAAPAEVAATLPPSTRVVALLCDPARRAYSMWRMWSAQAEVAIGHPPHFLLRKFKRADPADSFHGALRVEAAEYRVCMRERPFHAFADDEGYCQGRSLFLLRGAYAPMLRRWSRALGAGRLRVLFTASLEENPLRAIREVEDLLCLPPAPDTSIDRTKLHRRFNVDPFDCTRINKNATVARAVCSPDHWDKRVHVEKKPISQQAMAFMREYYRVWDSDLRDFLGGRRLPWGE